MLAFLMAFLHKQALNFNHYLSVVTRKKKITGKRNGNLAILILINFKAASWLM